MKRDPGSRGRGDCLGSSRGSATLRSYNILDTPPKAAFDRVARLAAETLDMPIALVSLLDEERQWFKARVGLDVTETPREQAFCNHTILSDDIFQVADATRDPRFAENPLVRDAPGIRFYAGAPLVVPRGQRIGTLCTIDTRPRELDERKRQALRNLAALAADLLAVRRAGQEAEQSRREAEAAQRRAEAADQAKTDFLEVVARRGEPVSAETGVARGAPPRAGVAGPAVPKHRPAEGASPLDRSVIDRLGTTLPAEVVASFLRRGLENAERACERMRTLPSGSEELLREAHSLKGTSGSFGLKGISAVAERIETRVEDGRSVQEALDSLPAVVAATRDALAGLGLASR